MMALLSIRALLFLVFLWDTGLGQPQDNNYIALDKMSIDQIMKKDNRQFFNIILKPNNEPVDSAFDDVFEDRGIRLQIVNATTSNPDDEKSIDFKDGLVQIINYDGPYFGLTVWTKLDKGKKIHVVGYFRENAHGKYLLMDEMKESVFKQRIKIHKIIFDDKVKLILFMTADGKKKIEEIKAGSNATVVCKVRSIKGVQPKFKNHTLPQLDMAMEEDKGNKEIRLSFRASKEDHLKRIWCVANGTKEHLEIKVFHAPTVVRIKPTETDTVMAGGHLKCSAVDGYPQPNVTWQTVAIPPNGDRFYRITQTPKETMLILNDNATVGSVWTMSCVATNGFGTFNRTITFTVEMNQTGLLVIRLRKLEGDVKQLHNGKLREILVNLTTILETLVDNKITPMKETLKGIQDDGVGMKTNINKLTSNYDSIWSRVENRIVQQAEKYKKGSFGESDKLNASLAINWFVWKIENISKKWGKNVDEYSPSFRSDGDRGYNLCLNFYSGSPDISDSLYLTFNLMPGDDDDRQQWPMSRTVLIEIIDELNGVPLISRRVCRTTSVERKYPESRKKAYDKPTSNRNGDGDGFVDCVTIERINSTHGAIRNDSMTVRCRVLP